MKPLITPSASTYEMEQHVQVSRLLPWYAQHRLSPEEQCMVDAHLHTCAVCRSAVSNESVIASASEPRIADLDVERAWAKMSAKLDGAEAVAGQSYPKKWSAPAVLRNLVRSLVHHLARPLTIPMAWLVVPQLAMVLVLATFLMQPEPEVKYQVLGNGVTLESNVVVVFKPEANQASVTRLLQKYEARIVDGPTVTNAYLLRVPEDQVPAAIREFRQDATIEQADSLQAGGRQ